MNFIKHILLILLIGLVGSLKAQSDSSFHHCLYPESSFTIGASAIYGLDFKGAGINGRLYYNMTERFCFGPEFSYLSASDKSLTDINLIAHYIFDIKGIGLYPLGGINYSIENEINALQGKETIEAWGIVSGAGLHRNFKRFTVFAEYSHHFVNIHDDADFLNLGMLFMFNTNQTQ